MKKYGFTLSEVLSLSRKTKYSFGFTLAEVLITVGIIGVVSALTVPTLVKNHQRQVYVTQLHKVYNEILSATERYMNDQRVDDLRESDLGTKKPEAIRSFVKNYFKVVKDCGTRYNDGGSNQCFGDSYESIDGSVVTNQKNHQCQTVFTLPSGAAVCADIGPMEAIKIDDENSITSSFGNSESFVIGMEIDVNGTQGPNIYGRDMFAMVVYPDGTVDCNRKEKTGSYPHMALFCDVLDSNWQMNY